MELELLDTILNRAHSKMIRCDIQSILWMGSKLRNKSGLADILLKMNLRGLVSLQINRLGCKYMENGLKDNL